MLTAHDSERTLITVTKPIVNFFFEATDEAASFLTQTSELEATDALRHYHFEVSNENMVPTVLFFSLKTRVNCVMSARIHKFRGDYLVYNFLLTSPVFTQVLWDVLEEEKAPPRTTILTKLKNLLANKVKL